MSDFDINNVAANFLPAKDGAGGLESAPIERTSGSFYALGDDAYEEGPQIAELRLYGLTPEMTNNNIFYCDIRTNEHSIFIRRHEYGYPEFLESDIVAYSEEVWADQQNWTTLPPIKLTGGSLYPGVSGTVKFHWDWAFTDTLIKLFIPFSTRVALIAKDENALISHLELDGVNQSNSDNGVLSWAIHEGAPNQFVLVNPATGTWVALTPIMDVYGPVTLELTPQNGSGITGRVVMENPLGEGDGIVVIRVNDGIRVPPLKGTGTRALGVDDDGQIVILP